jgi:hypothetical protein
MNKITVKKVTVKKVTSYQVTEPGNIRDNITLFDTMEAADAYIEQVKQARYRIRALYDEYGAQEYEFGDGLTPRRLKRLKEKLELGHAEIQTVLCERTLDGGDTWEVMDSLGMCWIEHPKDVIDIANDHFMNVSGKRWKDSDLA